jgi:hypothetical protein
MLLRQKLALLAVIAFIAACPAKAGQIQGKTNRTDTACSSMATVRQADKALGEQRYGAAQNLLTGVTCPRVMAGTVVRGPVEREMLVHFDGSQSEFWLVRLPDGRQVWMLKSNIEMDGR